MARRRGNGEGALRRRPDGRWEARWYDDELKRHSRYAKTRREAQQLLAEALRDQQQGLPLPSEQQTVKTYLATWLEGRRPPQVKYKTWRLNEQSCRLYIIPAFGRILLVKLTPQHIQALYAKALAKGLASSSVHHIHETLHKALEDALCMGLVQRNVADMVKAPPLRSERPVVIYNAQQVRTLLNSVIGNRLEALYVLVLSTGMRMGELLGAQWRDLDLDAGRLTVREALTQTEDGMRVQRPKTRSSQRTIRLTRHAVDALRAHRTQQLEERLHTGAAWQDNGLLFCTPIGTSIDPSGLRRRYRKALKAAGLPYIPFHSLRHTAATLMIQAGVPIKVVSEMLGHGDIATTLRIYAHVLPDMQASATSALEAIFDNMDIMDNMPTVTELIDTPSEE